MKRHLEKVWSLGAVFLSLLFLNASSYTPQVTPPAPANMRDVSLVQSLAYQYPYAPPFRTSADGRVALSVRELAGGQVQFYLFLPEAIDQASPQKPFRLITQLTPPLILPVSSQTNPSPYTLPDSDFGPSIINGAMAQQHHTLCDGTVQTLSGQTSTTNPYTSSIDPLTCPVAGVDCYKLWVITPVDYQDSSGFHLTLYRTPITVQVKNPKTPSASIVSVVSGTPIAAKTTFQGLQQLLEPMITADGHLLVGRVQGSPLTWTGSTGSTFKGKYNIVYSVAPVNSNANPCDVDQWTQFFPMTHAYNDPNMHGTYGLADYPLRDSENNAVPEPYDIEGNYPWIDRMGRNLFFTNVNAGLFNPDSSSSNPGAITRYGDTCVSGGCNPIDPTYASGIGTVEEISNTRGVTVAGRWTHGKMVQLDALVNNIDYGLFVEDDKQRMVNLYQNLAVQLGSGRYNGFSGIPTGYAANTTILDSFENLFTYLPTFRPITLREVVWQLNMGKGGDEVAFDDYINPDAFIISEMTASTAFTPYQLPDSTHNPVAPAAATYHDGFDYIGYTGFTTQPIHLQNAATAVDTRWKIPQYGAVTSSSGNTANLTARVEPAALGGIKGKGFWLGQDGNYISYTIPSQTVPGAVLSSPWFVSLFVDIRTPSGQDDGQVRRVLTFPDNTQVNIKGLSQLQLFYGPNGQQHELTKTLPPALILPTPGWWHLAFQITSNGTFVGVYVNGYLLTSFPTQQAVFQLTGSGPLAVGGGPNLVTGVSGFNGWIDEFKVIAQDLTLDPETICNHARGTLGGSNSTSTSDKWPGIAASYPPTSHTAIRNLSNTTYSWYACYHDYSSDGNAVYLGSPEFNTTSGILTPVRTALHFPEGPLVWNQDRPDSTGNKFCVSCHTDQTGQFSATLQTGALCGLNKTTQVWGCGSNQIRTQMSLDTRRQPMHPARWVFGNVPQNFVSDKQLPTRPQVAPEDGAPLDTWVFPSQ